MSEEEMNRILKDPNCTPADVERVKLALLAQIDEAIGEADKVLGDTNPRVTYKWVAGWQSLDSIDPRLNNLSVHYTPKADKKGKCNELGTVAKLREELAIAERHGHQCRAIGLLLPDEDTYDDVRVSFIETIDYDNKSQVLADLTIAQLRDYFKNLLKSFDDSGNFYESYCPIFFFLPSDKMFDSQQITQDT